MEGQKNALGMGTSDLRAIRNHVIALLLAEALVAAAKFLLQSADRAGAPIGILRVIASAPWAVLIGFVTVIVIVAFVLVWAVPVAFQALAKRLQRGENLVNTAASGRSAPAFIVGKVMRFAVVDAADLSHSDFTDLDKEIMEAARQSSRRMWYVAWVQIDSINAPTRATDWHFEIQKKDGSIVPAAATRKRWTRPKSWPDIQYTTLDAVEHNALNAGQVYNVLIYLTIEELASNLALETFQARFTDGNGRMTTLMMDEARNAKRIFDEAEQAVRFRDRVPLFAQAIRNALVAYHGRTDADETVDNAVHAECTGRIGRLVDSLETALGRTDLIDSIRNGDYFSVRGMTKVADSLDIAAGKLPT